MFHSKTNHVCTVKDEFSESFLPRLKFRASYFERLKRFLRKLTLVAEHNPGSSRFFFSPSAIITERKKQVQNNSWIIHPFSVFRLYYEMWMTVIFFFALIQMPMQASFHWIYGQNVLANILLCYACILDVLVNFCTGYTLPCREVEMDYKKIAKHYATGYFIPDVLSSLPMHFSGRELYRDISNHLSMLKIVRIFTFFSYMERSLEFFGMKSIHVKVIILTGLTTHYIACFAYYIPMLYIEITDETFTRLYANTTDEDELIRVYLERFYFASSLFLGVDKNLKMTDPWITYFFAIFEYLFGKFFFGFVTVMFLESYRIHHCVETKYFAMMSQVDAFMSAYKFPPILRVRMRQYYAYKYHQKYFNENRIEKFISEKLRREIKYQTCQTLVRNVIFFETIPTEILENIVNYLRKEIYLPKDVIIKAGEVGNCMYFLSSGTVSVTSFSGKEICHLKDGDYFGEISLVLPGVKTTAHITALEICELYKLDRKSFKKCLENELMLYKEIQDEAKRRYLMTKRLEKLAQRFGQDTVVEQGHRQKSFV